MLVRAEAKAALLHELEVGEGISEEAGALNSRPSGGMDWIYESAGSVGTISDALRFLATVAWDLAHDGGCCDMKTGGALLTCASLQLPDG
jgi:hypothetical protein